MIDEVQQKMAIIDNLSEENQLIEEELSSICFGIADEGVVEHR